MYQPGDDAAHLIVPANPCTECEGEGRVCVGVEPMTYSGSGDSPRFRDVYEACSHCDGSGGEPVFYCDDCGDVQVCSEGDQCLICEVAEARGVRL